MQPNPLFNQQSSQPYKPDYTATKLIVHACQSHRSSSFVESGTLVPRSRSAYAMPLWPHIPRGLNPGANGHSPKGPGFGHQICTVPHFSWAGAMSCLRMHSYYCTHFAMHVYLNLYTSTVLYRFLYSLSNSMSYYAWLKWS